MNVKSSLFGSSILAITFFAPQLAHAQGVSGTLLYIQSILNSIIPILIGIAAIIFMWGLISFIGSTGDEKKRKEANGRMVFGIVILAVMLGIWGIVNVLVNTLDLDSFAPPAVEVPAGTGGGTSSGGNIGSGPTPLVPCGRSGQALCTACDLYKLAHRVMNYIMFLAVPLAVLSISVGGAYILFGAGLNEGWIKTGKEYIWTAITGLIIVSISWLVINTIISQLARPGVFQAPWNAVECYVSANNASPTGAAVATEDSEPFVDAFLVPQDLGDECVKLSGSGPINMTIVAEGFDDTPYNREFFHRAALNFEDFNFGPFAGKFTIYKSGSLVSNSCSNSHVVISIKNESGAVGDGWVRRCAEAGLASGKVTFFKEAFELQGGGCTDLNYTLAHELGHAIGALYDEHDDGRNVIDGQYANFGPKNCIKVDSTKSFEDQRKEACSYFQSIGAGSTCYQGCGGNRNYWRDSNNDLMSYEQTSFGPADTVLINQVINKLVDAL